MKDLEWKEVFDRRVALVPSNSFECGIGKVRCPFTDTSCRINGESACYSPNKDFMFITEDQLPAYLAARLTS